jgi:hypothetical protein
MTTASAWYAVLRTTVTVLASRTNEQAQQDDTQGKFTCTIHPMCWMIQLECTIDDEGQQRSFRQLLPHVEGALFEGKKLARQRPCALRSDSDA